MWKRVLALVALLTLGCTGMTESIVELSTGGEMEISENGDVTMTLPDGSKVVTKTGQAPPDDFPLPPPWEGATCQTLVTTTNPDGHDSYIATYELERTSAEVADFYEGWLKENGRDVEKKEEKLAGMVVVSVSAKLGDGAAAVSITEAYGANSVSVVWAPAGMEAMPQ